MFNEFLADINFLVGFILFLCYSYQIFYTIVPFSIKPRRHKSPAKKNNIAIFIAARNEEDDAAEQGEHQNGHDPRQFDLGITGAVDDEDDRRQADEVEEQGDGQVVGRQVDQHEE